MKITAKYIVDTLATFSDPCLLSLLPGDCCVPGPAPSTNTNNSELNSLDSGIPEEIPSGVRTKQGVIMLSQCNVRHILFI